MKGNPEIEKFFTEQLEAWPMAAANFEALKCVKVREIEGLKGVKTQFNPARIVSTGAKVDAATLKKRPCFLCEKNRPAEQYGIDWGEYVILINPFPIAPRHFTIPKKDHTPQRIEIADMMRLAEYMDGYTIFYNGARCGASAPDHMHFQAVNNDFLPLWQHLDTDTLSAGINKAEIVGGIGAYVIKYDSVADGEREFKKVMDKLAPTASAGEEPMINVLCRPGVIVVIPRKKHRPDCYGTEEGQLLLSPASIDLSGLLILPVEKDFNGIDAATASIVLKELCYTADQL